MVVTTGTADGAPKIDAAAGACTALAPNCPNKGTPAPAAAEAMVVGIAEPDPKLNVIDDDDGCVLLLTVAAGRPAEPNENFGAADCRPNPLKADDVNEGVVVAVARFANILDDGVAAGVPLADINVFDAASPKLNMPPPADVDVAAVGKVGKLNVGATVVVAAVEIIGGPNEYPLAAFLPAS